MSGIDWLPQFTEQVGAALCNAEDSQRYTVDEHQPACVCYPETVADVARVLTVGDQLGLATIPVGHGSQLNVGQPPHAYDVAVSSRRLNRILAHEAADLTVTLEAGVVLADLNHELAKFRQHLPLDPPHPESATIGAIIASDAWGPWRYSQGKVRDLLIGIKVALADGTIVKGGGQVVKNVAGYDLMKLFTGSFGTLGVIVEASFKLRPLPERHRVVGMGANDLATAVDICLRMRDLAVEPFSLQIVSAGSPIPPTLEPIAKRATAATIIVGLAGSASEIEAQVDQLRKIDIELEEYQDVEASLRDLQCAISASDWVARLGALPSTIGRMMEEALRAARDCGVAFTTAIYPGAGSAWIRFGGGANELFAEQLRGMCDPKKGSVVFPTLPAYLKGGIDPWGPLPAAKLQGAIKAALDPRSRFGRYF